jgi:NAD(P)-dependent dehydrogenase (short-subunit alcohol dehydrogenase family)
MFMNQSLFKHWRPDLASPTQEDIRPIAETQHYLPIGWVEPVDISNAILFLASDESRYVTGIELPVDGGALLK